MPAILIAAAIGSQIINLDHFGSSRGASAFSDRPVVMRRRQEDAGNGVRWVVDGGSSVPRGRSFNPGTLPPFETTPLRWSVMM